jgi:hypothetical protein
MADFPFVFAHFYFYRFYAKYNCDFVKYFPKAPPSYPLHPAIDIEESDDCSLQGY